VIEAVVDTSAVTSILFGEVDEDVFKNALLDLVPVMSVGTCIEFATVAMRRLGPNGVGTARALLDSYETRFVPVDARQSEIAWDALIAFGRGRKARPAVLNYGDLFSYALAKARDLPLLYKGDDFAKTDIRSALDLLPGG
jgi:ribonuclease VapC